jgi:hypothetical protein
MRDTNAAKAHWRQNTTVSPLSSNSHWLGRRAAIGFARNPPALLACLSQQSCRLAGTAQLLTHTHIRSTLGRAGKLGVLPPDSIRSPIALAPFEAHPAAACSCSPWRACKHTRLPPNPDSARGVRGGSNWAARRPQRRPGSALWAVHSTSPRQPTLPGTAGPQAPRPGARRPAATPQRRRARPPRPGPRPARLTRPCAPSRRACAPPPGS